MNRLALFLFAFAVPSTAACDDSSGGGIALEFQPATTTGALTVGVELADGFTATRLEALVREVKLLPYDSADENDAKFKAKGDFWIDALSPDDSTIPPIGVPAGTYKKVEFKFEKTKDGLDGADYAIALDASIDGIPVLLRLEKSDKVTLRNVDGLYLAAGGTSTFLIDLDVPGWFTGVDVSALLVSADGAVHIDKDTNKGAYDQIAANLKTTIKLLRKP